MAITAINDFRGGLNLTQSTEIKDNQFVVARNMFYNKDKLLETRRGIKTFGNTLSSPITSIFGFQRDDTLERQLVCNSGDAFYTYDEGTDTWTSQKTGLTEFETISERSTQRTRWDHAVYKNVIYMCNGVDQYASWDGTTYTEIGFGSSEACTFDNTTDKVNHTNVFVANNNEIVFSTTGTLPAEITAGQVYYAINVTDEGGGNYSFQITETYEGSPLDFTDDGTGTHSFVFSDTPRIRYIQQLTDRLYGAGDDNNPSTLYYSNSAPLIGTFAKNAVVIGGDEAGRINGISELGNIVLAGKSEKIYSVNVTTPEALPIDAQQGLYSDRCTFNIGNSLAYLSPQGFTTLKQRFGVSGSSALEGETLDADVRQLTQKIENFQLNANAGWFIKGLNNYYVSFDTNNDNIPDTTLVWNTLVGAWTQYDYPTLYDYGEYIDSNQEKKYLITSGGAGQTYEIETGFDDDGVPIEYELETKRFDFGTPGLNKTFDYVDIIGLKSKGFDIEVDIKIDGDVQGGSIITDANIDDTAGAGKTIGTKPIGLDPISGEEEDVEVPLYRFVFRVPLYLTGGDLAVNMSSTGGVWILEKMRISRDDEPIEVFGVNSIG